MSSIDIVDKGISLPSFIRVALCPVGNINAVTFKKYAAMIQACNNIRIGTLTRFQKDNMKSPFKKIDWAQARMKFYFVDGTSITTQHGDFQQYRKIHAIVGIMSCISEGSIEVGFQKYQKLKQHFASSNNGQQILCGRCFAVEEPLDMKREKDYTDLIVIPNQDQKHLGFYIEHLFADLAAEVLRTFETYASTPTGLLDTVIQGGNPNSLPIKKQNLKTTKICGDYALLVGDNHDAYEKFSQGAEAAKQLNDDLYAAGCLEASASALYLLQDKQLDDSTIKDVADKMDEAINYYAKVKNSKELHVEALLKIGHFLAHCGKVAKRASALEYISKAVQEAAQLTTQDRILVSGAAAKICYEMGCMRKFGFFLRYTSLLHHDLCNQGVSIRLGAMCLDAFNIPISIKNNQWEVNKDKEAKNEEKRKKLKIKAEHLRGWRSAQQILLEDLVEFANAMSPPDYLTEAQLLLHLLSDFHEHLTLEEQKRYFSRFCSVAASVPKDAQVTLRPFPILKAILPMKLLPNLDPHAVAGVEEKRDSIFIFSPFDKEKDQKLKINWVQNELAKVEVVLHNPFKINLNLVKIALKMRIGDKYSTEVYENNGILKSDHEIKFIMLLRPLDVGKLIIEGIEIDFESCPLKNSLFVPWDMKQQIIREKRRRRLEKYKQQTNNVTSAMSHSKQNDEDYNENEEGIEIHVVEAIPLLNVFLATTTSSLLLHDGELLNTTIKLQNVGALPIDFIGCEFENKSKSDLAILSDANSFCPLMPHEPGIDLPLVIRARWNGNDDQAVEVILTVRYGNKSKKWFRIISLPLKLTVTQGLVLEQMSAINESFGKEIVVKIRNMADVPFVLLSNDDDFVEVRTPTTSNMSEMSWDKVQEKVQQEKEDEEKQNDGAQFDKGIPFAPGAVKLILIGPQILHPREESAAELVITDPDNQFLEGGDPHRDKTFMPYTADLKEYTQFIASRLRWKSYMNTSGTVGCGFVEPLHIVIPELASERKQLKEARERRLKQKLENEKEEVDIDTLVTIQPSSAEQPYVLRNTSKLAKGKVVEPTPLMPQQALLSGTVNTKAGEQIAMNIALSHDRNKVLRAGRVVVNVYQDGEEGSRISANTNQYACSGKLVTALGSEFREDTDNRIYDIALQLFFLQCGAYRVTVECLREGTEQKLSPPVSVKIVLSA